MELSAGTGPESLRERVAWLEAALERAQEADRAHHRFVRTVREVSDATSVLRGEEYFRALAAQVGRALAADYCFVGRVLPGERAIGTLASFADGAPSRSFAYDLAGTPCEGVLAKEVCSYRAGVARLFPDDRLLSQMKVEGYVGVPLYGSRRQCLGILVAMFRKPIPDPDLAESVLLFFASRTGQEVERALAESARVETEARLRAAIDSLPFELWMCDRRGRLVLQNLRSVEQRGDRHGQAADEVLGAPELARAWSRGHALALEGEPSEAGARDERGRHLRLVAAPITRVRQVLGTLGLALDVTERQLAEEERAILLERERAARMDAQAANRTKDDFLAVLSHELRNPLAPIAAAVQLLRRRFPEEHRLLDTIERNVRQQARLVDDLLDISRITRGALQLQRTPLDLARLVGDAVEAARPEAQRAGLALRAELGGAVWVFGDALRLEQILANLLSNAFKFTPAGTVTVRVLGEGDTARIEVEDTGIGLEPSALAHLFEMFERGPVVGLRRPGLGIGLAITRNLAELHGGSVRARSGGAGKGSRFTVDLPRIPEPDRAAAPRPAPGSAAGIGVMVVEDNPDARAMLCESLDLMGYRVSSCDSGEEALEALQRKAPPDVLLADIGLPGIDGYELLRRARKLPQLRGVPAFAITAYGQASDVTRAREAGFDSHFVKPVDLEVLDSRIRSVAGAAAHRS
ncbi:MAG TPA: ATP-binding protein [Myxococcales bacterium]|jgi:signal transduction histidine kinase/CheY-like chemotaxis protein